MADEVDKGKRGRPCGVTDELIDRMTQLIRTGVPPSVAAGVCGLSRHTFYHWSSEKAKPGPAYERFRQAIKRAEDEAHAARVARVIQASAESWQAAAWYLERRYPEVWGRKDRATEPASQEEVQLKWADEK